LVRASLGRVRSDVLEQRPDLLHQLLAVSDLQSIAHDDLLERWPTVGQVQPDHLVNCKEHAHQVQPCAIDDDHLSQRDEGLNGAGRIKVEGQLCEVTVAGNTQSIARQ